MRFETSRRRFLALLSSVPALMQLKSWALSETSAVPSQEWKAKAKDVICLASHTQPPLTTIQVSQRDVAEQAVGRLCAKGSSQRSLSEILVGESFGSSRHNVRL
jgi:hypothetical protein